MGRELDGHELALIERGRRQAGGIERHDYVNHNVSRAEFAAQTFRIDAMLSCLLKIHGGPHDIALGVTCKGCQAIRDLEATLGMLRIETIPPKETT